MILLSPRDTRIRDYLFTLKGIPLRWIGSYTAGVEFSYKFSANRIRNVAGRRPFSLVVVWILRNMNFRVGYGETATTASPVPLFSYTVWRSKSKFP